MKIIIGLIAASLILSGTIVVVWGQMRPIYTKFVMSEVRKNCAEIYHVDYTDTKTSSVVRTPIEEKVKECVDSIR